jgi:hypothetical protein
MTILGFPITIFFGILTIISLFITTALGLIYHYLHRPVFRYHKLFALITVILAIIHTILVISVYYL